MRPHIALTASASVQPASTPDWAAELPASIKRRDPRIWQMAYASVARLFASTPIRPRSLISATALGALDETKNFLDGVFTDGFGSPRNFIASVHSSMAGKLALEFKINGPNLTFCDGPNSLASSIVAASLLQPEYFPVLIVSVDENIDLIKQLQPHFFEPCRTTFAPDWPDGSVAILVDTTGQTSISASGPALCGDLSPDAVCRSIISGIPDQDYNYITVKESSNSFVNPAFCLHRIFMQQPTRRTVIGTYSPSAHAVAGIVVCS